LLADFLRLLDRLFDLLLLRLSFLTPEKTGAPSGSKTGPREVFKSIKNGSTDEILRGDCGAEMIEALRLNLLPSQKLQNKFFLTFKIFASCL
jgi:hypothetical protein